MPEPHNVIERAAAGDEAAWRELVGEYSGLLRAVAARCRANSDDAQDAAQATWLALFRHLGRLNSPDRIAGWLSTTMRRNCIHLVQQRQREQLTDEWPEALAVDDAVGIIDQELLLAERKAVLWAQVDRLPERQRLLVRVLFEGADRSYGEIAESMSTSAGAIGPTRQRALRRLRQLLDDAGTSSYDLAV